MVKGYATPEGTAGFFNARRELGGWMESSGLHCSLVGFGSYRVDDFTAMHEEALKTALLSGCNLIDTSTNYTDGGSERVIGRALGEMVQVGVIDREQVILVSKVGYVQGAALEEAQAREESGKPFPEMVKYQDGCWHCIHPEFLEYQLGKSMERLGVECIDFYLLHNPEYFLADAAKKGGKDIGKIRDEFYDRVERAFAFLEEQVTHGKIRGYGVSSNTFGAPASRPDATSLARMWACAERAFKKNPQGRTAPSFRVVQLPLNLYESGPFRQRNTGDSDQQTALEFASKNGLAVLVNRPLNAFGQNRLIRLADFPENPAVGSPDQLLDQVEALEEEFRKKLAPGFKTDEGSLSPLDFFRWSQDLRKIQSVALGADRWTEIEDQIVAHVNSLCDQITSQVTSEDWTGWLNRYKPKLRSLLASFRNDANRRSQKSSAKVSEKLDPLLPEEWRSQPLSRKSLGVLIQTPGVSCVLNGMRRPEYVRDSMEAGKLPRLPEDSVAKIYEAFRALV